MQYENILTRRPVCVIPNLRRADNLVKLRDIGSGDGVSTGALSMPFSQLDGAQC